MALFKVSRGKKADLPEIRTDGYCYFTTDDQMFYIDYKDDNGEIQRAALNAGDAETILGASLETVLNYTDEEFPTSKAILDELDKRILQSDWNQEDDTQIDYIKNKPEIATDDEIIAMLMEEDMFPVVTDSDGSVLADESGNILLW